MPELPLEIALDEVKERARLAGLPIPESRLAMVRGFLLNALRPIRALDSRTVRTVEPAVIFHPLGEPRGGDSKGGPEASR
jgi:hypothetical protein